MNVMNRNKKTNMDKEIDHVIDHMATLSPDSKEYAAAANILVSLCNAKDKTKTQTIKLDTIITGAFSLLGIAMIIRHEELNVLSSKALGFVIKGRV